MNVVSIRTGRPIPSEAPRVLLVTKHPFAPIHDGTSSVISLWAEALRDLGLAIDVLSFDYVASRWTDEGRARLARDAMKLVVVAAYGRDHPLIRRLADVAHAVLRGHRFLDERFRTDRASRRQLDALFARDYDLIVVHGVDAVHLAGPERLRRHRAATLLDIHDHVPFRILALQRTLVRMLGWHGPSALKLMSRSDIIHAIGWPSSSWLTRAEIAVAGACDRLLCSSKLERGALAAAGLPTERLLPISWPVARPRASEETNATAETSPTHDVGFIGSSALFNVEAILFFCAAIWPLVRAARPEATLLVAGKAGDALSRLPFAARQGITIAGWLADLGQFYTGVRIVVVPLLSGTGVSVKTMEAAARARAIVATDLGLRGLTLRHRIEVLRAEGARDFAAAVLALLDDPGLAARLGKAAAEAMAVHHDPAVFRRQIAALVTPMLPKTLRRQVGSGA
jgi:glycosyltransferase involved in cell wall biosynthesis